MLVKKAVSERELISLRRPDQRTRPPPPRDSLIGLFVVNLFSMNALHRPENAILRKQRETKEKNVVKKLFQDFRTFRVLWNQYTPLTLTSWASSCFVLHFQVVGHTSKMFCTKRKNVKTNIKDHAKTGHFTTLTKHPMSLHSTAKNRHSGRRAESPYDKCQRGKRSNKRRLL